MIKLFTNIRKQLAIVISTGFFLALLGPAVAIASPLSNFAAACSPGAGGLAKTIFPPWYSYLPGEDISGTCRVNTDNMELGQTAVLVALAVVDLLIRVSGMIAVGFIIYGSFQYIMSQGEPNSTANAKSTITNALIGLVIVTLATMIVQFIGRTIAV